jgi:hypothetical protein
MLVARPFPSDEHDMRRRLKLLALLAMVLWVPSAEAEPECIVPVEVWELELTRVERLSGDVDPQAVISALGARARLRGGYRDPARSKIAPRADLMGTTDGVGLSVLGVKRE